MNKMGYYSCKPWRNVKNQGGAGRGGEEGWSNECGEASWSLLVMRLETEFCRCSLTHLLCNDLPGGTNDFLHQCYSAGVTDNSRDRFQRGRDGGTEVEK